MPADRDHAAFLAAMRESLPSCVRTGPEGTVVEPQSTEEVAIAVRLAREHHVELAPPGVLEAGGRLSLGLRRMARVVGYDELSHLMHAEGGISLPALSDDLRRRGRTLPTRRELPAESL